MSEMRVEERLGTESIRSVRIETVASTDSKTKLSKVIAGMQKRRVAAAVITENGRVVGIFTERDVLNQIIGATLDEDLPISAVMTREPRTLSPEDRLADAIRLMTDQGYRHIPLVDAQGCSAGIISAKHIIDFIARHYPQEVLNLPPRLGQVPQNPEGS